MNNSTVAIPSHCQTLKFNLVYTACEVIVAIIAVVGNALVVHVFTKEKKLRRRTNYYIVSLAVADLFVGLFGIPFAIMSALGYPKQITVCLFTVTLLVVLCTVSIFSLVAVSLDRYWAILHPMGYSRNVRTRTALIIIAVCWVAGFIIGLLPMMGWRQKKQDFHGCYFLCVMDYNYLAFLYFGTIITPSLVIAAFYAHIYQVVLKQIRRTVTMNPNNGSPTSSGGVMLRTLGAAQTREVKASQNLAFIVIFFMICWIPLYTINCILAFCEDCIIDKSVVLFCVILSHLNSAGNPLLYAYHLKDFRLALKTFLWMFFGKSKENKNNTSLLSTSFGNNYKIQSVNLPEVYLKKKRFNINGLSSIYYPRIESIIKSSSEIAVSTANIADAGIWKISKASSDSEIGSVFQISKNGYQTYIDNSLSNFDDDVFFQETFHFPEINFAESEFGNSICDTSEHTFGDSFDDPMEEKSKRVLDISIIANPAKPLLVVDSIKGTAVHKIVSPEKRFRSKSFKNCYYVSKTVQSAIPRSQSDYSIVRNRSLQHTVTRNLHVI